MAKIKNVKIKSSIHESGYFQITGNEKMAKLFQQVQSTCISNGTELEKNIYELVVAKKFGKVSFLDFIEIIKKSEGDIYFKSITIKKKDFLDNGSKLEGKKSMVLDTAYFCFETKTLHIGEIKNGMGLDTKKSEKEIESLSNLREVCNNLKLGIEISIFIVLFICLDLSHPSIKTNRTDFVKYTGKKFCELIKISHEDIISQSKKDAEENEAFVINTMREIVLEYDNKNEIKIKKDQLS